MEKIIAAILSLILGVTAAEPMVPDIMESITPYIEEVVLPVEQTPYPPEEQFIVHDIEIEEDDEEIIEIEDEPKVTVTVQLGSSIDMLRYGDDVELYCTVESDREGYALSWEYSDDECDTFHSLGWHLPVYRFVLTPENLKWYYRVVVSF